jgi:hypothetical protein
MSTRPYSVLGSYFLDIPNVNGQNGSMVLRALRCNNRGASDRWLQTHASLPGAALPADTAVPLFAPLFLPLNYISEDTFPDGRVVVGPGTKLIVSSTAATLTRDAAATVDISAEIDEFEFQPLGTVSTAGDATTARKELTVWTDANGPKRLLKAECVNSTGDTTYLQLFAIDAPAEGAVPLVSYPLAANAGTVVHFGNNGGIVPYRQDADGTAHDGAYLVFSSTAATKTIVLANSGTIKAYYK